MTTVPNSAAARDIAYLTHPNSNFREHENLGPLIIDRGDGIYVYDDQGNQYIEALAGLWSVAVGFRNERLIRAMAEQMEKLPFYHTFMNKSHGPAIDLAEKLVQMTPRRLQHVLFANSGSEANDTAVKVAWYYNHSRGMPQKRKFISRSPSFHGVTVAAASLTGNPINHHGFGLPLPGFIYVTCPNYYRNALPGETEEEFSTRLANELEDVILREGPSTVAAFLGEPLMAGGGVIVPPTGYWEKVQAVCRKYDVLVVVDEVINGFGRLGQPFGSDVFDIDPDMMTLSKAITSSYQPLSALLISDEIYQHVADETNRAGIFGHGYTTAGHPVATAAALANLRIIEEDGLVENARQMGALLHERLGEFADHPMVGEIRGIGLIAGIELVADKATKRPFDPAGVVGAHLAMRAQQEQRVIVRAIGDTIALSPPLIINADQVEDLVTRLRRALDDTYETFRHTL